MDTLLLGITVVSLVVALAMCVIAWRLMRDDKRRAAARIAALSAAAGVDAPTDFAELPIAERPAQPPAARTPWKPAPFDSTSTRQRTDDLSLTGDTTIGAPSTGFLGSARIEHGSGSRQRGLAIATVAFFIAITGGFIWTMSEPEGTSAVAVGPNRPLELVSLSHARDNNTLAVSGLVRNPASGQPVEKLSAVVFLFDRTGTFVSSSRAHVDFLKLAAGDESPFVVSIDAPPTVARYRVSFRTDDGVVPHIDRRGDSPLPADGEQPVNVTLK
jgi:hypothetical protein